MEFWVVGRDFFGNSDFDWHFFSHALHSPRRFGFLECRAHHAGREQRLAGSLLARERCELVFPGCLRSRWQRHLLWFVPKTSRIRLDGGCRGFNFDDGYCFHGVRSALGSDEFLGSDCHHESFFGVSSCWRTDRRLVVGWFFCG